MISKIKAMQKVRDEVANLTQSPLYQYRIDNNFLPVIGEGSPQAEVVFIGEAPGKNEALTGKPFCGASGRVLDQLLATIGLNRGSVYITNIVKDRPPENRDPTQEEIDIYAPFLIKQLNIIQPKIIVTLGRFAMSFILSQYSKDVEGQTIGNLHGYQLIIETSFGSSVLIPLYHPAASIYNQKLKDTLRTDFLKLKEVLNNYE